MKHTLLRKGDRGEDVRELQKLLHVYPDGIFGENTDEAVRDFQEDNSLKVDGIVGERTWMALEAANDKLAAYGSSLKMSKRKIKEIIIHCTATPEGKDYTVADITRWHKQRGWSTIGYHYVIYRNGAIHMGRDVNTAGAHCTGHNAHSIGVVYVGGLAADGKTAKDTRTEEQKKSMETLLRRLKQMYPYAYIYGHNEFANKDCPSFNVATLRHKLK